MPEEIQTMIRDVAATVAGKSSVPFSCEAVSYLEQALEPVFEPTDGGEGILLRFRPATA